MKPGDLVKDVVRPYNTGLVLGTFLHHADDKDVLAALVLWSHGSETVFNDEIILIKDEE